MTFEPCDHHIQAEKLARITPEHWDEMGWTAPSPQALGHAIRWLNGLVLIPCSDGNVQIEVHYGGCDFELDFDANGPVVLLADKDDRFVTFDYTEDEP